MKNSLLIIGALIIASGLIFLGQDSAPATPSGHERPSAEQNITGQQAPEFNLERLDGGKITLSDYKGEMPVILDFWASWCPNCRRDMPRLSRFYETYKNDVEVIGINLQENRKTAGDYISSASISFPIALDPFGATSRNYGVRFTNTHILIDSNGDIFRSVPGDISEAQILELIEHEKTLIN